MRVPPSETVTYQRPDHRLWPSTGTLLVTGHDPQQGVLWLDQKTPNGPKDWQAGSWSHWDTIHFTHPSVNGNKERGYVSKVGWDHRLVIKRCPFTLRFSTIDYRWNGWILFCCENGHMTQWKPNLFFSEMQNRCDPFCLFAFLFYLLPCQNLTALI